MLCNQFYLLPCILLCFLGFQGVLESQHALQWHTNHQRRFLQRALLILRQDKFSTHALENAKKVRATACEISHSNAPSYLESPLAHLSQGSIDVHTTPSNPIPRINTINTSIDTLKLTTNPLATSDKGTSAQQPYQCRKRYKSKTQMLNNVVNVSFEVIAYCDNLSQ